VVLVDVVEVRRGELALISCNGNDPVPSKVASSPLLPSLESLVLAFDDPVADAGVGGPDNDNSNAPGCRWPARAFDAAAFWYLARILRLSSSESGAVGMRDFIVVESAVFFFHGKVVEMGTKGRWFKTRKSTELPCNDNANFLHQKRHRHAML
jgi:hypothetical protein